MSQEQEIKVCCPSFMSLLFLIFLVLKLTGYITWSWWWVAAPLWGPIALFFSVFALIFAMLGVAYIAVSIIETLMSLMKK